VAIIEHPDIRRMLLMMKAFTEGMRALLYTTAFFADISESSEDEAERTKYHGLVELLTPVCKAWPSDMGFRVTEWAMQCFGGYGYCSDYPAEQYMRDIKITSIYEGTNGIQAIDLLGRKISMKGGTLFMSLLSLLGEFIENNKSHATLEQNNIYSNDGLNVQFYSAPNSSGLNNWWGTVDCSQINDSIVDCQDDSNLGCLDFSSVLNAPSPGGNPSNCTDIVCFADSDCGTDGWTGDEYCNGDNVWDTSRTYECINPGTAQAECSYDDEDLQKEECTDTCESGSCVDVECYSDDDCGNNSWLGMDYCNGDNVWDLFRTHTCSSPGTSSAACSFQDDNQSKEECLETCSNGTCTSVVDLLVKSAKVITKNLTTGKWISLQYVVENIGSIATENASWELDTDSPQPNPVYGQFTVEPGETVDIYPAVKYAWPGNYSLVFSIDTAGLVDEHNETNNQAVMQITIG